MIPIDLVAITVVAVSAEPKLFVARQMYSPSTFFLAVLTTRHPASWETGNRAEDF